MPRCIVVWVVKSGANSILSCAGICILGNLLWGNSGRTWFRYDCEVLVSFLTIHLAFHIRRLGQAHKFLGLEVSAGPWISDVGWRLENSRSGIGGTKPIDLCHKWVHLLVVTCYDYFHFLSSISSRARILIFFICFFSFHHRIERRNSKHITLISLTTRAPPAR